MTIRPAGPEDLDAIAVIQAASPEASQWNPADYLGYTCLITDNGFIVTREVAPSENEILNLAVAPSARRSGIARALLTHVIQASPGTWFLEVRASNEAAIRLYQKAGFLPFGNRQGYYRDSPETAIVMRFQS